MHLEKCEKNENLKKCAKMWKKTHVNIQLGPLGRWNLGYAHLSQPGTGNHVFYFFILIIIFWIENYHSLFISVKFFIIFSFLFFLPLAFSLFFPLLRKWSLGIATRCFFSNPFRFFSFCFVSVLFWLFFLPLP